MRSNAWRHFGFNIVEQIFKDKNVLHAPSNPYRTVSCSTISYTVHATLRGLKMFLLLSCWILAGVMAEDPTVTHYKLKNSSLCLHVRKPPPYKRGEWTFGGKVIASDEINPNYTEKVVYNHANLSLCLKELTHTDTGIYQVSFRDPDFNSVSEKHRVIVQEAVPRPVILMSVLRSNLSAGFCSITVNCSINDDWLWSVCDVDSCTTSQKSFSKVNITISSDNRTVVCSGNNHVSTNNVSKSVATTCFSKSNPEQKETSQPLYVILVFVAVCVFVCALIAFMAKRLSSEYNHCQGQTSTAQLIQSQPTEEQPQPEPRLSTSSSSEAEAPYENVDASQPRQTSSPREEMGSMPSEKADTVYSFLQAKNVTPSLGKSDGSKDMKGHKMIGEASTSQSVIVDEAEHPTQIDTVYSMLQKSKNLKS
ncbi:uncharacterized protein LOC130164143 isoform X1 [Seriola aureovittata]|uniref:uncharacterized protein LOC130164143 isoform X1 n=1 Tax=Seriola aureovittata TaxID=2871759 RepID=UPI0024BE60BF|nr:uncharacterized protein LOC130164143 isoform X1 [Seriola aureovittata]XP_056224616.1 uncharacterized protein LOC130164143 isoform X1 [Seriola aureovittata]